jgi:hypothetical protein
MKMHMDRRVRWVGAAPDCVFRVVCRIGGDHGWFFPRWIWQLRGWIDHLVGGPGLRAGRRHPEELRVGDSVDSWLVTAVESSKRLELRAETKLPGEGTLEFELDPEADRPLTTRLTQTASFKAHGLWGTAYWLILIPVHKYVFSQMIRGIGRESELEEATSLSKQAFP